MRNLPSVLTTAVVSLTFALLAASNADGRVVGRAPVDETCAALRTFDQRVEAYAALHRRLAAPPLLGSRFSRHEGAIASRYLASEIKAVRAGARQGDMFTPEATRAFRAVIAASAADFGMFAPLMDEDGRLLPGEHPALHTPLPLWVSRELPESTLLLLPALPPELEYRMVDYDLVLWDADADLIVDVMPYAVSHPRTDAMYR